MHRKIMSVALTAVMALTLVTSAFASEVSSKKPDDFSGKVDIGGYSLYANVQGKRQHGSPTVVFENGNGDTSAIWSQVAPIIAQQTRVVTYDRVGTGQSDSPARETVDYTAKGAAERLYKLLKVLKIKGPLVLVGHSIGGLYTREYQSLYKGDVKGIVFVDSSTEHQYDYIFHSFDEVTRKAIIQDSLANGTGSPLELAYDDLIASYAQLDSIKKGMEKLPIHVLSGGNHNYPPIVPDAEISWADRQVYLASISSKSVHQTDPLSGHYLHTQNPQFVINSINGLLARIK
jgi:pimeloyl-ACP methyl ester carboxylesterase